MVPTAYPSPPSLQRVGWDAAVVGAVVGAGPDHCNRHSDVSLHGRDGRGVCVCVRVRVRVRVRSQPFLHPRFQVTTTHTNT
jgi:hypothetical protein